MIIIPVELAERPYDVIVGDGAIGELASLIPRAARRAAIVTQSSIPVEVDTGIEQRVFTIGEGEPAKSLSTVESLCRDFAAWGLNRNDVVVGVGGGLVTDVAGFAAAVYHRGVACIHVLVGRTDRHVLIPVVLNAGSDAYLPV